MIICFYCNGILRDDHLFCTKCGKKRKEVQIDDKIFYKTMPCIYGPPMNAKYVCKKCGYTFTTSGLGTPDDKYCPKCGNNCEKSIILRYGL